MTTRLPPGVGRHIALVGFMGAGKTTIGREVARLTERPFVDTDEEFERRHGPIGRFFEAHGEPEFRRLEEQLVAEALGAGEPAVISLGGGSVTSEHVLATLRQRAFTVWVPVEPDEAWRRVQGTDRPLARSREAFDALFASRAPLYRATASDASADDVDGVLLKALDVEVGDDLTQFLVALLGAADLPDLNVLVADERVITLHKPPGPWDIQTVPAGEAAKTLDVARRLWSELRLERGDVLAALGGGSTTDVAGFVAAAYMRGVRWIAIPTTLVGQVDAAIGGKTGVDLEGSKNAVGAFHFPSKVVIDPRLLATLPDEERRQGMAEVVKTGLLAGRPLWELPQEEMVRACAAFKCAVVLSDPFEEGRRAILNLGHTFGHALEAASDFSVRHGDAVALGLLAALRLSGQPTDVVEEVLAPQPVRVDRERAWQALKRDKKAAGGRTRLVLLPEPGRPEHGVELPDSVVRAALDELVAD